jgi:hypothetical protein
MALTKRRGPPAKAGSKTHIRKTGKITLPCLFCGNDGHVDADTSRFICSACVIGRVGNSALPKALASKNAEPKAPKLNKDGTPRKKRAKNGEGVKVVKVASGRGRGWHLKQYFLDTKTGEEFSFGTLVKGAAATKAKKAATQKAQLKAKPVTKKGKR